jgi:hypothetical protein
MSRNRSYFIYFGLALGLICYLTFIDKKIPGTKEQEDSETRLYQISPDDVTGLEITNVHGLFIFQKDKGHWEIKQPIRTPADGPTVDEVINQILYAQPQRSIPIDGSDPKAASDLKEWGLSPATERVVIHTKDKTYELLVGRKMAINDSIYARASGRKNAPVRIVPNSVKTVLQKDLSDFRSRNVFDFDTDKVVKIDTRVAETPTTPAQECAVDLKDGKWTLEKPLVARAAEQNVLSLSNSILGLHVIDFIVDDASNLSQYGLTAPGETLTVTVKPQEELVLQIGAPVPGKPDQVYAQRVTSNSVFTLAKSAVDAIFNALPDVRDRHVMPFDPGKATGLSFSFGKKKGDARNEKGLWHTVSTPRGHADVGKVTDILAHLSQLETTPVLKDSATDLKPFGLDKPQGKITVDVPTASAPLTLLIGKDENKLLYVRNSVEPFIYTIADNALDFLPDGNLDLLDARAIDLKLADVKSMIIHAPPAPAIQLTRSPGGTWTAANVKDRMVDSIKADTQASLFCQLQAQKWLGPVQPSYKFDQPVLTLTIQAADPKPTVLTIGATLPDGTHAAEVSGNPTTFAIADGDFAVLNSSSLQAIPDAVPPPPPATNASPKMDPVDPAKVKTD